MRTSKPSAAQIETESPASLDTRRAFFISYFTPNKCYWYNSRYKSLQSARRNWMASDTDMIAGNHASRTKGFKMLHELPRLFHPLLHRIAEISVILGPDWHLNIDEHHVSWRYREADMFPVAVDFTSPPEVQMYYMDVVDGDDNEQIAEWGEDNCAEVRKKIAEVVKHCEESGITFGFEQQY